MHCVTGHTVLVYNGSVEVAQLAGGVNQHKVPMTSVIGHTVLV